MNFYFEIIYLLTDLYLQSLYYKKYFCACFVRICINMAAGLFVEIVIIIHKYLNFFNYLVDNIIENRKQKQH